MILTGIGDEAANLLDTQIQSARDLDWGCLEMRGVEVPGFPKANFHDISEAAFDVAVRRLENSGTTVYCFGSTIMNWARKLEDPFSLTLEEVKRAIPRMLPAHTPVVHAILVNGLQTCIQKATGYLFDAAKHLRRSPELVISRFEAHDTDVLGVQPKHARNSSFDFLQRQAERIF